MLLLVGCGKMGSALLSRWEQTHPHNISEFAVIEPSTAHAHHKETAWFESLEALPSNLAPEIIVFAVKPQMLAAILHHYRGRFGLHPLYISIAAGKNLAFYHQHLGEHAKIVRAMPNTPALVGKGMTALCAHNTLPESYKHTATALMQSVGKTIWVEEAQMDAVTAISGSGPAYAFLFMEALAEAAIAAGLTPEIARELALATLHGSVHLAEKTHEDFTHLRKNVTSPGGTTEAALAILMKDDAFAGLVHEAVKTAMERARLL